MTLFIQQTVKDGHTLMSISIIIPTLNAGGYIERLLNALSAQKRKADEIIVVDSQSKDDTVSIVSGYEGVRLIEIERSAFDHGGTRDMALRESKGDFVLFLTQDALPEDEWYISRLLAPFGDPAVAAVGGRQKPCDDARPFERAVREYSYPADNRVWTSEAIGSMGVRAFLISDCCSAYRREAYLAVGGFDHPIMTNEDMLIAEKLLHSGYKLAYCGDAAVMHSHNMTLKQQYKRNYIVGRTMKRYEERFERVKETGTGARLAFAVFGRLLKEHEFAECICFAADCAARLLGNRIGRLSESVKKAD